MLAVPLPVQPVLLLEQPVSVTVRLRASQWRLKVLGMKSDTNHTHDPMGVAVGTVLSKGTVKAAVPTHCEQ